MTTPNGSDTPPTQPADEELAARLAASWQRGVATAEDDLARTDLVAVALAGGRRRPAWRSVGGAILGVAALLLAGAAIIVGGGGLREAMQPLPSPRAIASIGAPVSPDPTPYEAGSPGPSVEPSPVPVGNPSEGIPVIEPGIPFPPSVDGKPVLAVGSGAEEALAAATDDSPIYMTGWLIGPDARGCGGDFDLGSPAPNGVMWKACTAAILRANADGGATLPVHMSWSSPDGLLRGPKVTMAMEVLLRVHAHDPGCLAEDCAHTAVYEAVVQYRGPRIAPAVLAASMPPGGTTMSEAVTIADAYLAREQSAYSDTWILLRAELGSRLVLGASGGDSRSDWVWAVWYVSADGYYENTVYVGYLDGLANESTGGNLRFP
jgi:hypothetical protein